MAERDSGVRADPPGNAIVVIKIAIEPRWTHDIHRGEIEITERELAGKTPEQRTAYIEKQVEAYVNEECPYGWHEEGSGE